MLTAYVKDRLYSRSLARSFLSNSGWSKHRCQRSTPCGPLTASLIFLQNTYLLTYFPFNWFVEQRPLTKFLFMGNRLTIYTLIKNTRIGRTQYNSPVKCLDKNCWACLSVARNLLMPLAMSWKRQLWNAAAKNGYFITVYKALKQLANGLDLPSPPVPQCAAEE
jgi:hypothetical protein